MKTLSHADLHELSEAARQSPRKRSHRNLHPTLDAAVQRLAIAMEPDTYVRPHRHPHTWEVYMPLCGQFKVVIFNDSGEIVSHHLLGGNDGLKIFELPLNTWHSVVSLETGSVIFEVKEGPYIQPNPSDTGAWSPAEGSDEATEYREMLRRA